MTIKGSNDSAAAAGVEVSATGKVADNGSGGKNGSTLNGGGKGGNNGANTSGVTCFPGESAGHAPHTLGAGTATAGGVVVSFEKSAMEGTNEEVPAGTTANGAPRIPQNLSDSRFGGLAGKVEASIASSVNRDIAKVADFDYFINSEQLGSLSDERTRSALADILEKGVKAQEAKLGGSGDAQ